MRGLTLFLAIVGVFAAQETWAAPAVTCGQTISASGRYSLAASCTCPGNGACLSVNADNVTLNLNNKVLTCNPTSPTREANDTTLGVKATSLRNFTMIGCDSSGSCSGKITGCYFGLVANHSTNLVIERVDFSGNTYVGTDTSFSTRVLLKGNTVNGIAGYLGVGRHNGYAIAFYGCGTRCTVTGNIIKNVMTQPNAVAPIVGEGAGVVQSAGSTGAVITHNWFENDDESAPDIGVRVGDHASATVQENTFTGFWHAISGTGTVHAYNNRLVMRNRNSRPESVGVYARGGRALNNVIVNYATAIFPMVTDGGGNIVYTAPK